MKTADYRTFKVIMLPFSSLNTNCKQANWSVTGIFSITWVQTCTAISLNNPVYNKNFAWSYLPPRFQLFLLFQGMWLPQNGVFLTELPRDYCIINFTISCFIAVKASDPVKDRASADIVQTQLKDLSQKFQMTVPPTFVSHKIKQHLKLHKVKPSVVNQQFLVYQFKCYLCDAGYAGYMRQHFHQCIDKHKNASSSTGKHFYVKHSYVPRILTSILPS